MKTALTSFIVCLPKFVRPGVWPSVCLRLAGSFLKSVKFKDVVVRIIQREPKCRIASITKNIGAHMRQPGCACQLRTWSAMVAGTG